MDPSNVQLIDEVVNVLRDRVAPAVGEDPWVASELRSICSVLSLVAARLEHEDAFVAADNTALGQVLEHLAAAGLDVAAVGERDEGSAERNRRLREALEDVLPGLHDGHHAGELAEVRAYLREAARSERDIYGPLSAVAMY